MGGVGHGGLLAEAGALEHFHLKMDALGVGGKGKSGVLQEAAGGDSEAAGRLAEGVVDEVHGAPRAKHEEIVVGQGGDGDEEECNVE